MTEAKDIVAALKQAMTQGARSLIWGTGFKYLRCNQGSTTLQPGSTDRLPRLLEHSFPHLPRVESWHLPCANWKVVVRIKRDNNVFETL